jgi:hypothetical protein
MTSRRRPRHLRLIWSAPEPAVMADAQVERARREDEELARIVAFVRERMALAQEPPPGPEAA